LSRPAGPTAYDRADTALDLGPADTHRRAPPWTTGQLAAGIRDGRPVTGPGAAWTRLTAHHGYTTVTVARAHDHSAPTDTRGVVHRQVTVTTTTPSGVTDGPGHPSPTPTRDPTRTGSGWRIAALQDHQ